jgi:hypothetical protein
MYASQSNLNVPSGAAGGADSSRMGFRATVSTSNIGNWSSDQAAFGQSQYEPGYLLSATTVRAVHVSVVMSIDASYSLREVRLILRPLLFQIPSAVNALFQCMQSLAQNPLHKLLGTRRIFSIFQSLHTRTGNPRCPHEGKVSFLTMKAHRRLIHCSKV